MTCKCGCKGATKGGNFLPGHDSKFYRKLRLGFEGDERYERFAAEFEDNLQVRINAVADMDDYDYAIKAAVKLEKEIEVLVAKKVLVPDHRTGRAAYLNMVINRLNKCSSRLH